MLNWLRVFIIIAIASLPSQAAFISFGVNNIAIACPDSVPAPAAAFGFNTCTFYDSMQSLGTVDVNQTGLPGFNWYTQQGDKLASFTGSISGTTLTVTAVQQGTLEVRQTIGSGGGLNPTPGTMITALGSGSGGTGTYTISASQTLASTNLTASLAQAPNTMSASASGLTLTNVSTGDNNWGISAIHQLSQASGPPIPYHGTAFLNGLYIRAYLAFDENLGQNITSLVNARWPAWWTPSFAGIPYGSLAMEVDILDALPGGMGVPVGIENFLHEYPPMAAPWSNSNFTIPARATLCNPVVDATTFHTYDMLWVPTTKNSGTGYYIFFFDIDTCSGNAIFTGSASGTTLTVTAVTAGSLKVNSYITGIGIASNAIITGLGTGSGGVGTYTLSSSSTASSGLMIASNQNSCQYFLSPANTPCVADGNTVGAFSSPESTGSGLFPVITSGCQNYYSTTDCNVATHTGDWPMTVKKVQVWQTSIGDRVIK